MSKYKVKQIQGKLMLTSSDIQVGDIWYASLSGKQAPATKNDIEILKSPEGNKEAYKVIGEISPEAIWIKEGYEIDDFRWQGSWISSQQYDDKRYCQIECPTCKTFH